MTSHVPTMTDRHLDVNIDPVQAASHPSAEWRPACDVWEDQERFYVQFALPGWQAAQMILEVENLILTVRGARQAAPRQGCRYHLRESDGAGFTRHVRLPAWVDGSRGRAVYRDGLLTVSFPKRADAKPRRILVEV